MLKILSVLTALIQVLMGAALVALEILSGKRGGINHHVLARKHQWSQSILSPERLQQGDVVLGLLVLLLTAALAASFRKPARRWTGSMLTALLLSLLTLGSYHLPVFAQLRTSAYVTQALAGATLLQLMLLGIQLLTRPGSKS